jgi:methionyl-tRNA synthetase
MKNTFYVTTPIYYVNAAPHIGHAYTTIVADALTKFKRQRGVDAFFLTGTDEHGINIERKAEERGIPIKQHVDEIVGQFQAAFAKLDIGYDRWIRTTDPAHEEAVQKLWKMLEERGHIYKGHYEGWFCGNCNEFKDVETGEENPVCPVHLKPLDRIAEESYFFRLSAFAEPLLELYEKHPDFVQPEARRNEVISFVASGLKDLSVSRVSVKWGIPVPGDEKHTIYVWLDALSNYITALGWGNHVYDGFDKYWASDDGNGKLGKGLHLVGKDILRFHAVYWPAFLLAAGVELPRTVFVHGMLLRGGQKMGKSLGNAIKLETLHEHFSNDMIRYFLLREVPFGQDGEVTYEAMVDRINSDLANGLGNLASRTLTMVKNYFDGVPPRVFAGEAEDAKGVREAIERAKTKFAEEFSALNFSRALEAAWAGIASVDKFITDNQPWKLAKDESARARLETVIAVAYEALRHTVLLVAPVLPQTTSEIWKQSGLAGEPLLLNPNEAKWGEALEIAKVENVSPAFPKLNKEKIMSQIVDGNQESGVSGGADGAAPVQESAGEASTTAGDTNQAAKAETSSRAVADNQADGTKQAPAVVTEKIAIDDFIKVELRAATILEAERVPKADKLLRLIVEVGEEQPRQILAGIAEYYAPEEVVGRKIVIVANLAPRKMRGLESNGMLLAASVGEEGRPVLATFGEDVPNGTRLK